MTSQLIQVPEEFKPVAAVLPVSNHAPDNAMTVNARQLHDYLGIKTKYTQWIQRYLSYALLDEGVDFFTVSQIREAVDGERGTKQVTDYYLTLDAGKSIAAMQASEMGKTTRNYLIWAEKQWRNGVAAPTLPVKSFAATQQVTNIDIFKNMVMVFEEQSAAIAETKAAVQVLESRLDALPATVVNINQDSEYITEQQRQEVETAIDTRLAELGIKKSKTFILGGLGKVDVYFFVFGSIKSRFLFKKGKTRKWYQIVRSDFDLLMTHVRTWEPLPQQLTILKNNAMFDNRKPEGRELNGSVV